MLQVGLLQGVSVEQHPEMFSTPVTVTVEAEQPAPQLSPQVTSLS